MRVRSFRGVHYAAVLAMAFLSIPRSSDSASAQPLACQPVCTGDCDASASVSVNELVRGVSIALGSAALDECAALDVDASGAVSVDELVTAVQHALGGCRPIEPLERAP